MPAASAVIDNDDVLEARIASGDHDHFQFAQQLALDVEILDDRLDHQLRADEIAERVHRNDRAAAASASARAELAFGRERCQRFADLRLRRVGGAHARIEEVHAMPRLRGHLRDARAHRAGADDADLRLARQCVGHRAQAVTRPVNRGGRLARNAATPSR